MGNACNGLCRVSNRLFIYIFFRHKIWRGNRFSKDTDHCHILFSSRGSALLASYRIESTSLLSFHQLFFWWRRFDRIASRELSLPWFSAEALFPISARQIHVEWDEEQSFFVSSFQLAFFNLSLSRSGCENQQNIHLINTRNNTHSRPVKGIARSQKPHRSLHEFWDNADPTSRREPSSETLLKKKKAITFQETN